MGAVVSIVRGEDPEAMVKEALDLLGGLDDIVSGDNALIKPNLGAWISETVPNFVNRWATTKPEILVAVIKELKNAGIKDVSVAEGAFLDQDATTQFEESGIKEMVEALGGTIIDLDEGEHVKVDASEDITFEIGKPVLETDNLINVPVMKTHVQTRLTLGIKNLKGIVSKMSKRMMHRGDLESSIALLSKEVRPKLTIVDGLIGLEGLGPTVFGRPKKPGLIIVGTDPVSVDAVTATIMGHNPREIEHIRIAWEMGLGEIELGNIEIRGIPLEEAIHPFEPANLGVQNMVDLLEMGDVRYFGWTPGHFGSECTGCIDIVINAMVALRDDVTTIQRPLDIVIGSRDLPNDLGNNVLLYGNCQAKNRDSGVWLSGCPPDLKDSYTTIAGMTLSRMSYVWALIKRLMKGNKVKPLPQWKQYEEMITQK
jgi:uncharacterized protein (DUF362 family)